MAEAVLFLVGASGVGKTAALERLSEDPRFLGSCHFFDSIGVPSKAEMLRTHGSGEGWQAATTREWTRRLVDVPGPIAILEGQTRPSYVRRACELVGVENYLIILLDCRPEVRHHRLSRNRTELATVEMEKWAAYLRGQADALGIAVVDTSDLSIDQVAAMILMRANNFASMSR